MVTPAGSKLLSTVRARRVVIGLDTIDLVAEAAGNASIPARHLLDISPIEGLTEVQSHRRVTADAESANFTIGLSLRQGIESNEDRSSEA